MNEEITKTLQAHRIAPVSDELKARILQAAEEAAGTGPEVDNVIPAKLPLLRLAACLAISASVLAVASRHDRVTVNRRSPTSHVSQSSTSESVHRTVSGFDLSRLQPRLKKNAVIEHRERTEQAMNIEDNGGAT